MGPFASCSIDVLRRRPRAGGAASGGGICLGFSIRSEENFDNGRKNGKIAIKMVRIPQTLEDLKSYSTFLSILPSDADSKATAEEKKRIMALQRPFYEAYKSHCRRTGQAIIPPENFRIDMLLKLCAGERNFEFFDPHTITDPKRALLRHYSALSDGTFIPNERGEFVAIVDSSTGDKRFVHYSQVYGLESYVLPLLDILNIALAISFQTMNLSIAMMNDYMTETENINLEIERLAQLYRQLAVGSINSSAFPEKLANGEAALKIFVQLDKATVRAMQELGVGLKDQEVIVAARVKPIFVYWHRGRDTGFKDNRTTHWQWHIPIIDGTSGKVYEKAIFVYGKDTNYNRGYLYDKKTFSLPITTLEEKAETLDSAVKAMGWQINDKYLDPTRKEYSKEVTDAIDNGQTLYSFIMDKKHKSDFFKAGANKANNVPCKDYEYSDGTRVKDVSINLWDYQNPIFASHDLTAKDFNLLNYLNEQKKVHCAWQDDLPGDGNPITWGDGDDTFITRTAILPTYPDRYVWVDNNDVKKYNLPMRAQPEEGETMGENASAKNVYPLFNTRDATVKKSLTEMLNDPELDVCYVEVDDITSAQEVLRQDIDRLTTDMQVPSNTVSHENNTLQMILQLASNIVANIGDQMTKTNGNIRI